MIEAAIDQLWLIVSILCGFIVAMRWTKNVRIMTEIEDVNAENKTLRAKIARANVAPDLSKVDNTDITGLLAGVADYLPSWLKPLTSNPQIANSIVKYAKDNPDQFSGIINRLTGQQGPGTQEQTTNNTMTL